MTSTTIERPVGRDRSLDRGAHVVESPRVAGRRGATRGVETRRGRRRVGIDVEARDPRVGREEGPHARAPDAPAHAGNERVSVRELEPDHGLLPSARR